MKTPLNVEWHYYLNTQEAYTNKPLSSYHLINGEDELYLKDSAIRLSLFEPFIKSIPLTSDFKKPIYKYDYKYREKEHVKNIIVVPGIRFFITLTYKDLNYQYRLKFNIVRQSEDVYLLNICKESFQTKTYERSEEEESKYVTKKETLDILSKLPETIDLGIFKLPLGNCFECEPVED